MLSRKWQLLLFGFFHHNRHIRAQEKSFSLIFFGRLKKNPIFALPFEKHIKNSRQCQEFVKLQVKQWSWEIKYPTPISKPKEGFIRIFIPRNFSFLKKTGMLPCGFPLRESGPLTKTVYLPAWRKQRNKDTWKNNILHVRQKCCYSCCSSIFFICRKGNKEVGFPF